MQHKLLNKPLLFALIFVLTNIIVFAQTQKPIKIIVSGTTYDNPDLTSLKNYLKTKTGIAGLKTAFSNSTATLTFTSANDADDLWDDIPDEKKSAFNIISIDSKIIKLQSAKNSTATKGDKNCGCDYFPLCKYDETKSYGGKVYRGIRDDAENIAYYNCDGGIITKKWTAKKSVIKNDGLGFYDDYETYTYTSVILKSNEPVGASWTYPDKKPEPGVKFTSFSIAAKNATIEKKGRTYKEVIKVRGVQKMTSNYNDYMKVKEFYANSFHYNGEIYLSATDYYYAKGNGLVSVEDVNMTNFKSELQSSQTPAELEKSKSEVETYNLGQSKVKFKETLIRFKGVWKCEKADNNGKERFFRIYDADDAVAPSQIILATVENRVKLYADKIINGSIKADFSSAPNSEATKAYFEDNSGRKSIITFVDSGWERYLILQDQKYIYYSNEVFFRPKIK